LRTEPVDDVGARGGLLARAQDFNASPEERLFGGRVEHEPEEVSYALSVERLRAVRVRAEDPLARVEDYDLVPVARVRHGGEGRSSRTVSDRSDTVRLHEVDALLPRLPPADLSVVQDQEHPRVLHPHHPTLEVDPPLHPLHEVPHSDGPKLAHEPGIRVCSGTASCWRLEEVWTRFWLLDDLSGLDCTWRPPCQ